MLGERASRRRAAVNENELLWPYKLAYNLLHRLGVCSPFEIAILDFALNLKMSSKFVYWLISRLQPCLDLLNVADAFCRPFGEHVARSRLEILVGADFSLHGATVERIIAASAAASKVSSAATASFCLNKRIIFWSNYLAVFIRLKVR